MNNEIPKTILVEKILPRKGEEEKMYWNEYKIDIMIINNYNSNVQITYPEFQAFLHRIWPGIQGGTKDRFFPLFLQEQFKFVNLSGSVETINIIQQHPKYCIKGKKTPPDQFWGLLCEFNIVLWNRIYRPDRILPKKHGDFPNHSSGIRGMLQEWLCINFRWDKAYLTFLYSLWLHHVYWCFSNDL